MLAGPLSVPVKVRLVAHGQREIRRVELGQVAVGRARVVRRRELLLQGNHPQHPAVGREQMLLERERAYRVIATEGVDRAVPDRCLVPRQQRKRIRCRRRVVGQWEQSPERRRRSAPTPQEHRHGRIADDLVLIEVVRKCGSWDEEHRCDEHADPPTRTAQSGTKRWIHGRPGERDAGLDCVGVADREARIPGAARQPIALRMVP